MGQNLSYLVRMPKYGHIVFCSQLSQFLSNFDKTYKHVFRRLLATSRAPHSMVLSMLRRFGKIGPKIDQIWAWLSRGHRWAPRVRNPLKSSFMGHSLLVNCYLEIKFHKKSVIFSHKFFINTCVSGLAPPVIENISGANVPCSASRIRSLNCIRLSSFFLLVNFLCSAVHVCRSLLSFCQD